MNPSCSAYRQWNATVRAYLAFSRYDDHVYETVGDDTWHEDKMNGLHCGVTDAFYDALIGLVSGGREKSFWAFYDRFETPGGKKEGKPVAWDNGFPPEKMMYGLFKQPSRRAFLTATDIYKKMIKLEEEHEEKAARSNDKKQRRRRSK